MKQKYTKKLHISDVDVSFLVQKGFPLSVSQTLNARGINEQNYDSYFGNQSVFHSPFDMPNMAQAVDTINDLLECGGSVLICGDYDADGLTASAVLSLFFTDNGVENDVIIPTREEGYGLHADLVLEAFQNNYYDLVITVDCGISNAEEVARIVDELGVEVIVTDHHELPEVLPDCICINPKMGYPFPYLSGSGVAWKLVEALVGRETALKYVDVACIGTIADLMPMQDENRSIVNFGLFNWNHKSLKYLADLSKCNSKLTCSDIAMRIGPKINAAGRVGSPEVALQVLLARDKTDKIKTEKLLELNELRKKLLDDIIADADKMCNAKQIGEQRMVYLYSDNWPHGLLGIAAARYKEKYNFPTLIMTRDGDNYVGSARSVDNIHLFDAFCQCKDLLVKFGGHKASVGFTVSKDNLLLLQQRLSQIFCSMPQQCFDKLLEYDVDVIDGSNIVEMYQMFERLQPLLPQDKVIYRIKDSVTFANTFGKENAHLSATLKSGLAIKGFYKGEYTAFIKNGANVDLLCTLEIDSYNNEICGIVEDVTLCNSLCFDDFYRYNLYKNFQISQVELTEQNQVDSLLEGHSVVAIFDDYETYLKYTEVHDFSSFTVDVFFADARQNKSVVISPLEQCDFSTYQNVVVFGSTKLPRAYKGNCFYVNTTPANDSLYVLSIDRQICTMVYSALKRKTKFDSVKSVFDKYLLGKIAYEQFIVALRIFQELGLIKIVDKFTLEFNSSQKNELTNSKIYNIFAN